MAVIDSLPGLSVTIECNGNTLEEYEDGDELSYKQFTPTHTVKKYIECVTDAEFKVHIDILPGFKCPDYATHTTMWVDIDGKIGGGWHNPKRHPTFSRGFSEFISRINPSEVSRRKLRFCSIEKVDDTDNNRVKSDIKLAENLGEIVVHFHGTTEGQAPELYVPKNQNEGAVTEISEKALKGQAISHGVALGPERRTYQTPDTQRVYPAGYYKPLAMFKFKYRSRQALQQELIIPRSPSPVPIMLSARDVNQSISNRERLAELKREMEQLKANVKEEQESGMNVFQRGQKRKPNDLEVIPSERVYKITRHTNGTVMVDLTDDD
ncbi:hypothetical protein BGZ60DRAFT_241558 [Tricladium varicosporioides]|nr:hypothetical protein BGZ60DRAFT_241558 [Hymenoscyphus varicosporioides]